MQLVRHVVAALVAGSLLWSVPLGAQDSTGAVTGQVVDGTTQQPLANVEVAIAGTPHRMLSRNRSEEHTSELQSRLHLVCRLLLEKKKKKQTKTKRHTHHKE